MSVCQNIINNTKLGITTAIKQFIIKLKKALLITINLDILYVMTAKTKNMLKYPSVSLV